MTVTYTKDLHTVGWFSFFRLLIRWRGSFYKLILPQCLCFFGIYFSLLLCYTWVLPEEMRRRFESVISMVAQNKDSLGSSVAFFLGFFIELVFKRFWDQFGRLPWPDGFAFLCSAHLAGSDKRARSMRRTLIRYVCAATVMGLCQVAPKIKHRFPTYHSLTSCNLLNENEANIIESLKTDSSKHYLPLSWADALLRRARKEGRIGDDFSYNDLVLEIDKIRSQLGQLNYIASTPVPLVYVHVVLLAVYSFFSVVVLTHPFEKWMFTSGEIFSFDSHLLEGDLDHGTRMRMRYMFVIITFVQFCVYAGMLHTSEALLAPFGYNDNDIEIDQLVDRHLRVGYLIVDEMYAVIPELTTDSYWSTPLEEIHMPYTMGARISRSSSYIQRQDSLVIRDLQEARSKLLASMKRL